MRSIPSVEILNKLYSYEKSTGKLIFKKREPEMFVSTEGRPAEHSCNVFNKRFTGKEAGSRNSEGYICVKILGTTFKVHRVIWKMVYGEEPACIDHINRNPSDNRLSNLRAVSQSVNCQNKKLQSNNSSGFPGVYFSDRKWVASIQIGPNRKKLGRFATKEEAINARKSAEVRLGFNSIEQLRLDRGFE